jgi:hypothetical protein
LHELTSQSLSKLASGNQVRTQSLDLFKIYHARNDRFLQCQPDSSQDLHSKFAKFDKNVAPSWTVTPIVSPDALTVTNDANVQVNTQGDANDADPESPPSNDVSIHVTTQGDANATNSDSRFSNDTNDLQE